MLKTSEFCGATIDAAVNAALAALNKERDDITVEVTQTPKSGFLGIGAVPAKIIVSYEYPVETGAVEFVSKILEYFGVSAQIDASVDEENKIIKINLTGESIGIIIGRHGDTLDAIQYLTGIVTNGNEETRYRVILDTENYRAKREEALVNLAKRTAAKVLRSRRSFSLEPMSSYERRIIHSALQDYKGISTHSTGVEPNRRVVISPNGGYRSSYGGYSRRNQSYNSYASRPSAAASQSSGNSDCE